MLAVSLVAGLLFGLVPARFGSHVDVPEALKDGARVSGGGTGRIRQVLVSLQIALALMLLVGSGLLVKSFMQVAGLDIGFRAPHLLTAMVVLSPARYADGQHQVRFVDELLRRVQALPGVASAAVSQTIPMTGINDQGGFAVEGRSDPKEGFGPHANRPHVSAAYFDTLGIRLLAGRLFDDRDGSTGAPVAIVSELAVRRYWPNGNPLGRRLATDWSADGKPVWRQIVGVVQSTRHFGLEEPQKAEVYLPFAQAPVPLLTLVVRTTGNPSEFVNAVRAQVSTIDPQQSVFAFQTMEELVTASGAPRRFQTALVATFGALALILAAIGIYGVMGYMVTQRRREIGVRLALGARPRDVVLMVLRNGLWLTLAGVLVGLAGTFAMSRVLSGFLYGVSALDPVTYVAMIAVLVGVAIVAAYRPSRRAAMVDPLVVLRDG
jgi:putative ABC transport system permease protein